MSELNKYEMISWSPEMMEYLKELCQAIDNLDKINQVKQLFNRSLLLSMEEGWGAMNFIECIVEMIAQYYDISSDDIGVKKVDIPKDRGIEYLEDRMSLIKGFSEKQLFENEFSVIIVDLRERLDQINTPVFLNTIEKFAATSKRVLFIYWIPLVGVGELKDIDNLFSKKISCRTLYVPSISHEKQAMYMKVKLEEQGFYLNDASERALAGWIEEKDAEGGISGFHSLESMCSELIYNKLQGDVGDTSQSEEHFQISAEDIEHMRKASKSSTDAYVLLDELIGMTQVKMKIREIVAQVKLQKQLEKQGKNIGKPSMHMMFLGNPGTGKTTLARIVGQILKQEGLLSKGDFQECTGNDFVEGLLSNTVNKVRSVCKAARGSVLFVDEAYGMAVGHSNGNNAECVIPVFVAEMENHRDDMCVIFAGYEDEMKAFLNTNSGLKSRIPHIIHFPNYSREELKEIFFQMVEGTFEYEEELKETIEKYLEDISEEAFESKDFSNGRFVRNLYERVWGKAAYRINYSDDTEVILRDSDLKEALAEEAFASLVDMKPEKLIGFKI